MEDGIDRVLQAALALVEEDGLKALTLRPLAERLGVTVSALSYRFGRKDDLVAALVSAATHEEARRSELWLSRLAAMGRLDGGVLADFADAVLDEWAGRRRTLCLFFCELLQGAASRPEIHAPLQTWKARRLEFWRVATAPLGGPELAEALHAYSADEAAHGLVLGDDAAYRWLRRLSLRRLCLGLAPAEPGAEEEMFAVLQAGLGDLLLGARERYKTPPMGEWQAAVAAHAAALIISAGAEAVTHRAVAEAAGAPPSTLAYRFPRQEDLLKAGLEHIISRLQGRVDDLPAGGSPTADATKVEIARGTFAVALAATRIANLRGFAADMRRRRGENYYAYLAREAGGAPPLDRLAAQLLSIVAIGQVMLDGELGVRGAQAGAELIARLQGQAARAARA